MFGKCKCYLQLIGGGNLCYHLCGMTVRTIPDARLGLTSALHQHMHGRHAPTTSQESTYQAIDLLIFVVAERSCLCCSWFAFPADQVAPKKVLMSLELWVRPEAQKWGSGLHIPMSGAWKTAEENVIRTLLFAHARVVSASACVAATKSRLMHTQAETHAIQANRTDA